MTIERRPVSRGHGSTVRRRPVVIANERRCELLALECERLGDARVGQWFLEAYSHVTGDEPPPLLLHFYRVYRALRRARIAVAHLDDPSVPNPETFAARARRYLQMVEPVPVVPAAAIP